MSGQASYADCRENTLEFWGVNFGRLSLSGIPAGLMIGFAGNFEIANVHGGQVTIHYTTENFMDGESFVIIVDGKVVKRDHGVMSKNREKPNDMTDTHNTFIEIPLAYGTHVIEMAAESFVPHRDHKSLTPHLESRAEIFIKRILFEGSRDGGAASCVACPDGSVS